MSEIILRSPEQLVAELEAAVFDDCLGPGEVASLAAITLAAAHAQQLDSEGEALPAQALF